MTTTTVRPKPTEMKIDLRSDETYRLAADDLAARQTRGVQLESRRTEILAGLNGADADLSPRDERAALDGVTDEIAANSRAVVAQTRIVDQERARVSRDICDRPLPRHRAIVGRIVGALRELDAALEDEISFRDELNRADVIYASALRAMPLPALGTLRDPNSAASAWIADARSAGLLDEEGPR